jgi:hypothetical protein
MSLAVTTSLKVVEEPQWILETAFATPPTTGALQHGGPIKTFAYSVETNALDYRKLGSPDLYKILKLGERFTLDINFQPIDRVLISKAINLLEDDATDNREQSITWYFSQMMNNAGTLSEFHVIAKGCLPNSITIDLSNEAVDVSIAYTVSDIPVPNMTDPLAVGVTSAADITAAPWTGLSGGVNSITWNSIAYKLRAFSTTINQNVDEVQAIGDSLVFAAFPTIREISFNFDVVHQSNAISTDARNVTARAMSVKLHSTISKLTYTDAHAVSYNEEISAEDTSVKTISYQGRAIKVVSEAAV